MLSKSDTITIRKDMIREYGATTAIIIQLIIDNSSEFPNPIPLKPDVWANTFLDFIDERTIKSTITKLLNKGVISIIDDEIVFAGKTSTPVQVTIGDINPTAKKKRTSNQSNEWFKIAKTIIKVCQYDERLTDVNNFQRDAKNLLDAGYEANYIQSRYGAGGWWYSEYWKGQAGNPPKVSDIIETINPQYGKQQTTKSGYTWGNNK